MNHPLDPAGAIANCAALGTNGHTWRLPSIKELSTTVDETPPITKVSPAIDTTAFPDTPSAGVYMSSSMHGTSPLVMTYADGVATPYNHPAGLVRCGRPASGP